MRLNNFNIDFISGHVPCYQQKNVPVKTNQFYRDAFVYQMKEGQGLPNNVKRQMGLNNIFDDERNFKAGLIKFNSESKHRGHSNELMAQESRATTSMALKRRNKAASSKEKYISSNLQTPQQSQQRVKNIKKINSQQVKRLQDGETDEVDERDWMKQFIKSEQQKIYFVKSPDKKDNTRQASLKKSNDLMNKLPQVYAGKVDKEQQQQEDAGILLKVQDSQQVQSQQELPQDNLNESSKLFKDKFQNQNINKILSGRLDQDNKIKEKIESEGKNKFNRVSVTSHMTKRHSKSNMDPSSNEVKFVNTDAALKQGSQQLLERQAIQQYYIDGKELSQEQYNQLALNQNTQSQETSSHSMIFKLVKERQNNQQESYMKDIEGNTQAQEYYNQYQQENGSQQLGGDGQYQSSSPQSYMQYMPFKQDNILLGNLNTITPSMYKQISKVNQPILSSPVVITKYQINQHFSNSQTISNHIREKVNSEQRKELLSFFNENRYKFFSNNDLNAEKFFVTRNREKIKDLNFERIGIFKSKQPKTHVKNFRFFINDLKVSEPRFQNPLKTEQEQLQQESSFRKASQASHNSKLSSSDLMKETHSSHRDTQNIITGLIGDQDNNNNSRLVLNSPVGLVSNVFNFSSSNFNNTNSNNNQQFTSKSISPSVNKINLQSRNTTPYITGQSAQKQTTQNQEYSPRNSESNDVQNLNKLKAQYTNFVQQNINPKLQQVHLKNHQIKEEKDESILDDDQNDLNRDQQAIDNPKNKKTSLQNMDQIPSSSHLKSKKKLRIISGTQLSENELPSQRNQYTNDKKSSQTIVITEHDEQNEKRTIGFTQNPPSNTQFVYSSVQNGGNDKEKTYKTSLKQKTSPRIPSTGLEKTVQKLIGQDSAEFDENYLVYMQSEKAREEEYIYSKEFQEKIQTLEDEQRRLESIEDLFFLKLKDQQIKYYESEDFKIHRKKLLLDTILKNKKITTKDKKLIYQNLIYQYDVKSKFHSEEWCHQMTNFLMTNKFKYNLDEAANRKYQRAHEKIIQLPTFRDQNGKYYHDIYNFVNQLAQPSPLTTEGNEVHFQEIYPNSQQTQLDYQTLPIKRFEPRKLSQSYSHFQFKKFKY